MSINPSLLHEPTISVIIPVHKFHECLLELLKSLQDSSVQPMETIIVNDGNEKEIKELVKQFEVTSVSVLNRKGPACARNIGAKQAKGNFLLFLDSDISIGRDLILRLIETMEKNPQAAGVSVVTSIDPINKGFFPRYMALQNAYYRHEYFSGLEFPSDNAPVLTTRCCMIKKDVFLELGGFNEQILLPSVEDLEFSQRLLKRYSLVGLDPGDVAHFWPTNGLVILRNYFYRSFLWVIWGTTLNNGFGKIITTKQRAYATLSGGLSVLFWTLSLLVFIFKIFAGILTIIHIISNLNYYKFLLKFEKPHIVAGHALFTYIASFVILCGLVCGLTSSWGRKKTSWG